MRKHADNNNQKVTQNQTKYPVKTAVAAGLAALLAAGTVFAAGSSVKLNAKYEEKTQQEGPGAAVSDPSSTSSDMQTQPIGDVQSGQNGAADRYIEPNPVKKWGNILSADENASTICLNSHETGTDESGKNILNFEQEIVLNMAEGVPVLDAVTGFPVAWNEIDKNAPAYAWVSQAMTLSLPPETAAQLVLVNVPNDYAVPSYVAVKEAKTAADGSVQITDQDGNTWKAAADTPITPYLTRNMVYLSDVKPGSFCLIWPKAGQEDKASDGGQQREAEKITLFSWTAE